MNFNMFIYILDWYKRDKTKAHAGTNTILEDFDNLYIMGLETGIYDYLVSIDDDFNKSTSIGFEYCYDDFYLSLVHFSD